MLRRDHRTIQGALPILARALGRKLDVTVEIGGSDAYTDGKHIQLPALPVDGPSDELATLAFGYLEHEAAHVRYTDMDDYQPDDGLHQMFTNILEDVRIEKALGDEYPGFAGDLSGLTEILVRNGDLGATSAPDASLAEKMGTYVLLRGRYDVLGPDALKAPAETAEEAFRNAVPPGLATRVGAALGQIKDLGSTQDAAQLARDIVRFVREEEAEQRRQAEPPSDGGAPGDGETADGSDPGATRGQGEGGDVSSESGAGQAEGRPEGQSDAHGNEEVGQNAHEMADALRELLQDDGESGPKGQGEAAREALRQEAAQNASSGGGAAVGRASSPTAVSGTGVDEIAKVSGATVALRTRLRGLLAAAKRASRTPARRGKRLDDGRLVRAMKGDPRLFVNKTKGVAVNTAVQILLDRSGSMSGAIELARESALACGLGLAEIQGVSLAAAAFPGVAYDVEPLTRFGESVRRTAGHYASLQACGGTPMLEALLWGVEQLLMQREPRKICLVVTDGHPYNSEATQAAIRRCWAGGIEVLGIGIGTDPKTMRALFPVTATVSGVDELAAAMFAMLREALAGRPQA